jgi:hypothetical protein
MKIFIAIALLSMPLSNAWADSEFVTDDGFISVMGRIDTVGYDDFTIINNGERVDVTLDNINEDNIDRMEDAGIIKENSYVRVTGELQDTVTGTAIQAETIRLYGNYND